MKRPIALALLAFAAAGVQAVQDCELDGQHVNPSNGSTTAGKTGLMRCRDRDSGVLQREQELQDGKFMGLVRYYEQGKLRKEHSVNARSNMHGRAREFGPQGQVLSDSVYDNGRETGIARRFHPNGQLRRAGFHGEGGSEQAAAEFNEQGQLSQLRCGGQPLLAPAVDDARLCGFAGASQVEMFDARGALYARASYLAGQRVRIEQLHANGKTQLLRENSPTRQFEQEFAPDGIKRRETERTLDGKTLVAVKSLQYSEAGTLVRDQRWADGKPVSDTSFYLNGQPRSKTVHGNSQAGDWVEETQYRDDGSVAATGRYLGAPGGRRQPTGTHKTFNAAGRVVAESDYDARGRLSRERTWSDAGAPLRDDAVFEDGSRKAFAK